MEDWQRDCDASGPLPEDAARDAEDAARDAEDAARDAEDARRTAQGAAWVAEFEAASRRPLALRWRYSFIKTYKPVLDDAEYRSFDTMEAYRNWCEENLPEWLGYGRVHVSSG